VFDNSGLRRTFGPEKGKVVGELQPNIMVKKSSKIDGQAT
jgi:hypothetical protein